MNTIRERLPNLRTAVKFIHDGIVTHQDRLEFKLNMDYFFRTKYVGCVDHKDNYYDDLIYLEGDAGVCAAQLIFERPLYVADFRGKSTAHLGCNPVMMLCEVFQHDYVDLVTFLTSVGHACKGEMNALINYIYPYGFPYKGGPAVDKGKIKYPTLYIRNNSVHSQLPLLHNYIEYLKLVEQ